VPILPDDVSTQAVRGRLLEGYEEIEAANWNQMIQKKQFGVVDASFTWALYTGGRINIANKAASLQVQESETEVRKKTDELQCELVERYYGMVLAQQAEKVRNEVLQSMQNHLNDAEKLMQQGQISNTEYLHAKSVFNDADREHKKALRQIAIVNQALINTMAVEEGQTIAPVSNLFCVENIEPLGYFIDKAQVNSPC
jgi:outer membrane protein TolC